MEKGIMSTKSKGSKTAKLPKTYRKLCAPPMPRKFHDAANLEAAQEIVDALAVPPTRTPDQDDYLKTLAELVEADEEQITVNFPKRPGLETLKFLLAENHLTASDLSRVLGTDTSLGYPTIFALGIRGLGEHTKFGSSLIVMAIVGGAILPFVMGKIADLYGMRMSFSMPLICFLCVMLYAAFWPALDRLDTGHDVAD
jgi:antitoxin component HigA of HigAB toxin-antitoxin module